MKSNEVQQSIKLGVFVLVGLVLFFIAVFLVGSENNLFSRTFTAHAVFKNVEGLKQGDNVWLSGVKIGTVKEVRIVKEGRVVVALSLKDRQNKFIKRDATASIGSDGLVGSKIVVIRPGQSNETIQDADTIGAMSPADTQELINIARDVGDNTRTLTDNLKELTSRISEGKGIVGELLHDGDFARDLRSAAENIRKTTLQTSAASEELHAMLTKLNSGEGLVHKLATDTTLNYVFDQTLLNVKEVSENSAEMSQGIQRLIEKLNDGNNAIGVLLSDTAFAERLQVTLENAQSASAKLDENMEALQHNFLLRGYFRKKERREARGSKD
ncbi:MAG TPA: MlaD family protein [Ohtaekwangia sp.]|nr:MlaD family protein [Ohtaekwangia sp.]